MADTPEPGTQEAQDAGCTCPEWWSGARCPVHGIDPDREVAERLAREDRDDG